MDKERMREWEARLDRFREEHLVPIGESIIYHERKLLELDVDLRHAKRRFESMLFQITGQLNLELNVE